MTDTQTRLKEIHEAQHRMYETYLKPFADIDFTRGFTAEERENYERWNADYNDLEARAQVILQEHELEQRAMKFTEDLLGNRSAFGSAADISKFASEIRGVLTKERAHLDYVPSVAEARAISRALPAGVPEHLAAELRALSVGTASAGGNIVGKTYLSQLLEPLRQFSGVFAAGAYTLVTEKGDELIVPRLAGYGAAAAVGEAVALAGTDPTFNQFTLKSYKYGQYVPISNELITDSLFDIEGYALKLIGENISILLGQQLAVGVGTTAPTGVVTAATVGVTGATGQGGAFTWDNLIDLQESVLPPYQPGAAWVGSNSAVGAARKLKDDNGRYYWEPNGQTGAPSLLLGSPVFRDPFFANVGVGAKPLAYGDFSRYWVRLVGAARLERSDQVLFTSDQTAFRGVLRADANLTDASAIKTFQGGAS